MIKRFSDQDSIANVFINAMRNVEIQSDRNLFRHNLTRLGEIFAYEISKTLTFENIEVETPLGVASGKRPTDQIVIGTILRAGLPLHQGLLNIFDDAENAFVSAFRRHHKDGTFEVSVEYVNCPDLDGKVLFITDPMIATGSSMESALLALLENGKPKAIHIITVIASTPGLSYINRLFPKATIWVGAEDEELTAKSYIVPGLGDAGDLAYGGKKPD